jgi:membrane-associated phospholipid phosphatase
VSVGWGIISVVSQVFLLLATLQAYSLFRKTYFQRPSGVAFEHAVQVIDLQRALGLAITRIELPLQQRVLEHAWLVDFFNAYYRQFKPALYVAVALCVLLAPREYRRIRRVFFLATLIAWPWYALYPLAPPRLMEPYGYPFVDTLAVYAGTPSSSAGLGGANQFAAMPSMHIGWTLIVTLWLAAALPRWRIGACIGGIHLSLMCVAVVVTGNHYVLDVAAGFAVVGMALALTRMLPDDLSELRWFQRIRANPKRETRESEA